VPAHHAGQPLPLLGDGLMSALLELVVDLTQLRPHPLRYGDAPQLEPSFLRFSTQVCEAEEVERVGLPETACRPLLGGVPPELDQPGLVGMQFQPEPANRLRSSVRNRCASSAYSKPTMTSSAQRTMITSTCTWCLLHH
jgi:hypothetical protein